MENAAVTATIVASALAAAHLLGGRLMRFIDDHRGFASFSAGMALAYVFLQLIPEIETAESTLGDRAHGVTLLGMLLFYMADVRARRHVKAGGHPGIALALHSTFIASYTWLIVVALPETVAEKGPVSALIVAVAVALHMVRSGHALDERYPEHFGVAVRGLFALSAVAGVLTVTRFEVDPNYQSLVTAGLVGFLLLDVFKEELPEEPRLLHFFLGAAAYVVPIIVVHDLM